MSLLGERCESIGVRGEFTATVFKYFAGVENTFVTGCPSFFSIPSVFDDLPTGATTLAAPRVCYSSTHLQRPHEQVLLAKMIQFGGTYIELEKPDSHRYHLALNRNDWDAELPELLKGAAAEARRLGVSRLEFEDYFTNSYRLFRGVDAWLDFNAEYVDVSIGPRFHVNMAALLAGKRALWLTHDMRTRELCDYLGLPSMSIEDAAEVSVLEMCRHADYRKLFERIPVVFRRFNSYLENHGLPPVAMPKMAQGSSQLGV